ncbi:HAMP domain-containing histidine kinase [Pendulispora brunnea]|uniref:histidine kinase n=1 Tax=Pendulispora brunnea TaxID=2905690 RepID=A0ABZ2KMS1_9BACT
MLERTFAAVRGRSKPLPSRLPPRPTAGQVGGQVGRSTPVGHVSRVFRDVYEAERLSAGAIPLARKQEPLRALADAAFARLGKEARRRGLELQNDVDEALAVPCDPERILKVLLHLIENAIGACKDHGHVVVDARPIENGVLVSVHDEGAGLDPRAWPYLFREGWKDPSRKGEGLGLTVSKAIVHAHGGKIWCESALGRGTTFRFTIPNAPPSRKPEEADEAEQREEREKAEQPEADHEPSPQSASPE